MNVTFAAEDGKLNDVEVISELPGPRGFIVGPLCQSTNQRLAVTCEGSFPFPFQAEDLINESEVKTCMQEIDFYCRKCRIMVVQLSEFPQSKYTHVTMTEIMK